MDDTEDDARYQPKSLSLNRSKKFPLYSHPAPAQAHYNHDYDDDDEEEEEEEFQERNDHVSDANDREDSYNPVGYSHGFERYPKRQRLKNSVSNYEFVPRNSRVTSYVDGDSAPDWSDHEKFVLLEAWGKRFLQLGRKSIRSEDWVDVADKVSEASNAKRNEAQCRQVMDTLKRRYKKEMAKGANGSKWPYFKKMDMLLKQEVGCASGFNLACGLDSGEYVFMDTDFYLERANLNDEMRDSPSESEEEAEEEQGMGSGDNEGVRGLRVLADSVQKLGKIYEKLESGKREQMMELEKIRVDFQRELELQKKQILERTQAEIAKIREGDDECDEEADDTDDDSEENVSD